MAKGRSSKVGKVIVSSLLVASCMGVLAVGTYWAIKIIKTTNSGEDLYANNDEYWKNIPPDVRNFSDMNSFRVYFAVENNSMSQGTAWSFYLNPNTTSGMVEWYLATNFHVVNDAVFYNGGVSSGSNTYYKHKVEITKGFALQRYYSPNPNEENSKNQKNLGKYRTMFDSQGWNRDWYLENTLYPNGYSPFFGQANKVEVITDNAKSAYNQDKLDLFSNSIIPKTEETISKDFYNLDMSLIKISFDKTLYDKNQDFFNLISDPYRKWLNLTPDQKFKAVQIDPKKGFYMAGNPAYVKDRAPWGANLIPAHMPYQPGNAWYLETTFSSPMKDMVRDTIPERALRSLNEKSWRPQRVYNDWKLTNGASGSAVYQSPISDATQYSDPINAKDVITVGIFWGGSTARNGGFVPCFIPFITEKYNFYENFQHFLAVEENLPKE